MKINIKFRRVPSDAHKQSQQAVSVDERSRMRFAAYSLGKEWGKNHRAIIDTQALSLRERGKTPCSYGSLRIPPTVIVRAGACSTHKEKALLFLFLCGLFLFCFSPLFAQDAGKDKMIEKALMEYRRGNTPNALELIYGVLERYPKNARAIDLYGQIKNDEAKRLCRAAEIYFRNGEIDIARKRIEESRGLSVDIFISYIEEKIIEAKSFLSEQNPVMCGMAAAEILFFDPGNNEALKLKALLKSSFFRELYSSVVSEKKKLSSQKYLEAKKFVSNPIKALAMADESLKFDPSNAQAAKLRKQMLQKLADAEMSALDKSEKELLKDKEKALVYFLKAEKYYRKRKFEKVFKYLEKALGKDASLEKAKKMKKETGALICTAEIASAFEFLASGKKRAASRRVKKARRYDPGMLSKKAEELVREARKLMDSGEKEKAGVLFAQAALLNPRYEKDKQSSGVIVEIEKAWGFYRSGNYERCAVIIASVGKKYPENLEVMFLESINSAQTALDDGDFLKTRKFLLKAVKLKPLHREVWDFFNRMDELLNILGYEPEKQTE